MTILPNICRSIVALLALTAALAACDSAKSDTVDGPIAKANPAVEETAKTEAEDKEVADKSDEAESSEAPAPGGDDKGESAKRKDIRKLLEVTGSAKLGLQMANQVLQQFQAASPNVPAEFWEELKKDMNETSLVNLIVPIYDKHLTHDEIKALITFFETPAGKSYVRKLPAISQESQVAGQQWGMEIAQKVQKRLQAKGYR